MSCGKQCRSCRKDIQLDAVWCPYCGTAVSAAAKDKWYFRTSSYWIMVLVLGPLVPLALPFLWINPRFKIISKTIISIVVIAASYFMGALFIRSLKALLEYYKAIVAL